VIRNKTVLVAIAYAPLEEAVQGIHRCYVTITRWDSEPLIKGLVIIDSRNAVEGLVH
jgi:hypothetical protein